MTAPFAREGRAETEVKGGPEALYDEGGLETALATCATNDALERRIRPRVLAIGRMALRLRHRRPVFPVALVLARPEGGLDRPVHREEVLGDEVDVFRF